MADRDSAAGRLWCNGACGQPAVASAASVLAGGLGLSAFFWLPALLEKGFVKTDLLRTGFLNWTNYIIYPSQLFWSPWGFGYSMRGPTNGIPYSLGLVESGLTDRIWNMEDLISA